MANTKEKKASSREAISSVISDKMTITGELSFKGKTRIDGTLEGNLEGEYLVLSETGSIRGELRLDTLICHGRIEGTIEAQTVVIHQTATIQGKLTSKSLSVDPGARISGEICAVQEDPMAQEEPLLPQPKIEKIEKLQIIAEAEESSMK